MTHDGLIVLARVLIALVVGAAIGFERSLHGRPAGFRTHALVSLASTLLMVVPVFQGEWMIAAPVDAFRTDPTRMAQGIMTGIGFLGAGVIFKEGLTVRGLTTAASIWMTAALGILVGIGFYVAAAAGTVASLAVLAAFRILERRLPAELYAEHTVAFDRSAVMAADDLRRLIQEHGLSMSSLTYRLRDGGKVFEYETVLCARDRRSLQALSAHLCRLGEVVEFRIAPASEDAGR